MGSYRGFALSLRFEPFRSEYQAVLKGRLPYPVSLGTDPHGSITRLDNALNAFITRLDNALNAFADRIAHAENELDNLKEQQQAAQAEVEKPFPQEEELVEKSALLAELNAQLVMEDHRPEPDQAEALPRPSVRSALERMDKAAPVKPFKTSQKREGDVR